MHLAEPAARQGSRTSSVSGFDFAFVLTVAFVIVGSCFFMLEMAAARSSGQESTLLKFLAESALWLSAQISIIGKYVLLFTASIVNSALIVLFVQSLRKTDQRVSRMSLGLLNISNQVGHTRSKRAQQRRQATAIRESSPFLLSPVFR